VQLLVACSEETIQKAVQQVDSAELFILPVSLKGRACYRVCWGVYPDSERAASALHSVPAYFREGGATPKVVPASELLP
jgi:septal ring-binding cell division protein DamX